MGHSCGIYTTNDEHVLKLAHATKTSRLLVNQPQAASNSGNLWNGLYAARDLNPQHSAHGWHVHVSASHTP